MKKNNKGYSLVEIIIVMAIIGVVGSAGTISFRMIYNDRQKQNKIFRAGCNSLPVVQPTSRKA